MLCEVWCGEVKRRESYYIGTVIGESLVNSGLSNKESTSEACSPYRSSDDERNDAEKEEDIDMIL